LREHARASLCIATVTASLSCLPGCATPFEMFGQQAPAVVSTTATPAHGVSRAALKRQLPAPPPAPQSSTHSGHQPLLSPAIELLAEDVRQSGDNRRLPFIIIDKVAASIAAYDASGRLISVAPALLGAAKGDHSVPGIGERPIAKILPHERTTPAGRFVVEMGRNAHGEEIVWVDYDAAVSLHRVRATNAAERRLQRLASATPLDNRISYGCINIPVRYFDTVIKPLMRGGTAVAYVLPEVRSTQEVFAFARANSPSQTGRSDPNGNRAKRPG
jgi:hypothetical protein